MSKYPLVVTARTLNSLSQHSKKLLNWLKVAKAERRTSLLGSFVFHLADRANHSLPHVLAATVSGVEDLEAKPGAAGAGLGLTNPCLERKPVVLVSSKVFRQHLDYVNNLVASGLESFCPSTFESKPLRNLVTLHSALFAVQHASRSWIDCGLKISAVVGHSFGQLTALCISGAFSLPDALKLVSGRALLIQKYWGPEPGSMLFLQAYRRTVEEILQPLNSEGRSLYAEIACYNGPESHVVVGSMGAIEFLLRHVANMPQALSAFNETRFNYDYLAESTQALGFWEKAYPHQARLVLVYVVEAFAELGSLDKHKQLVRQLYRVLEDGKLITSNGSDFIRTNAPIDSTPAESIYHEIIDLYPQHASVHKLVVFGNRETKKTLEEMYEFAPLMRTPTLVLGDFLAKAFTHKATGTGKFRILEIGAGTGGTTRYIINHLRSRGIEFEYIFTDLGASLVNAAAKNFKGADAEGLSFDVLDIERPPKPEYEGAFHSIIATNCIHATRNLEVSLKHIRQMLRDDGALTLIEITKNMFWLNIVVGLLEGWWLFEDGREHALVDEKHWERRMKAAGFEEVAWSDGASPESKTVRVIAAFPHAASGAPAAPEKTLRTSSETVVYKKIGDLEIHADVYYPAESEALPDTAMPVALMIHGGSHVLFSRKDIRPAQTRLLLRKGFLPVSLDYHLCPEVPLAEGAMVDVCDALDWARNRLPFIELKRSGLRIDGENIVVVGWSSGAWATPPEANLIFYAPTDYEDVWWQHPIHPNGAPYKGQQYDVLEGVRDEPITTYEMVGAWEEPIADPRSQNDPRCRIVLHINWKAQTLPVILNGLPSRKKAVVEHPDIKDWGALPQPSLDTIRAASPRAQIRQGTYNVPTFFIHGTADDLIPWQQSQGTHQTMIERGIRAELVLLDGGPHICDLSSDPASDGWKATLRGYDFICSHVNGRARDVSTSAV
ncbi:alpha/beta-hydrolase [Xylariaceae sp. AK1471]|nr:alpha/beta-hydrolase [Xylariaceae sp. AK1471]